MCLNLTSPLFNLSSVRTLSRHKPQPETVVVDTLTSYHIMSGRYIDVDNALRDYHMHGSKGDLDVFTLKKIYILFKVKTHFILAVVINCHLLLEGQGVQHGQFG